MGVNPIGSWGTKRVEALSSMPRHDPRIALLIALPLLSLSLAACSAGADDGLTGFSGAYSAGPADGGDAGSGSEGSAGESGEGPATTASGADGTSGGADGGEGNPLCCQVGPQSGCDSEVTEACVCTSRPLCCQNVWSQECVDLAIACDDPFCGGGGSDDGTDGTTGDPGVDLECDPDFVFSPANPAAGVPFTATFSDPVGLTWVGMHAEGPGGATAQGGNEVIGEDAPGGPYHWSYDFAGLAAGVWTFSFTHRNTENGADLIAGTCQKQF